MSAKLEQTSQADMTNSLPDGTHSTSISLFMNSHLARHPIKQPQRFHPYSTGQRLHQNSAKLPKFSHCNLPMETCQELVGEICIGDCPPEINCDGPYASCPDLICTSSNCDELTGKDFCLGPCDTAPCDSNCDWMDWLQCDGTNCSRHRSDVECCCQRNQEQDSNANSSLLMSQEHFGIQSLYPLTPFTSLASTSSTPQSNPSQIRYSIHHQHQDSHILDILAQPPAPCPNTNLSPLSSSLITQLSEGMAQPAPHSDTRSQPQEPLVQERAVCLWGACRDTFATHSELVAHVNYYHLEVPKSDLQSNLFCRWADCRQQQPQIGPSNAMREFDFSSLDELAQHLLTDHLGFSLNGSMDPFVAALKQPAQALSPISIQEAPTTTELQVSQTCIPDSISNASADIRESTTCSSSSSPALQLSSTFSSVAQSPSASPLTGGSGDLNHAPIDDDVSTPVACLWAGCTETFRSLEALSAHVEGHVGSGKGEYHCRWDDCDRHGDKAFSSKQKILRHLQSHTGHRPFQCELCGQHFSEAATLQQHMRRHTSEKPYICDYPGCGKSFAVAGALTIHKRTHSGQKPFKCSFCERAFSESSNLSKHLRTHTGEKPYACPEPDCGKRFCRPDQLNRHKLVHAKKTSKQSPDEPTTRFGSLVSDEREPRHSPEMSMET